MKEGPFLTCIHCESGLCPECREAYDEDRQAYIEFGAHPAGQARWAEFERQMAEEAAAERAALTARDATPADEAADEIPF